MLVGVNPKDNSYQTLPWIYAAICAVTAVACGALAKRFEEQFEGQLHPQTVPLMENADRKS